ncbi:MAG: hypothetical protein HY782_16945 [Chloroflexi bacterium]|nr:hypothetical protein [Chloroflexota bacterium]
MASTMSTPKAGRRQKRLRRAPTSKPRKSTPHSVPLDEERIKQLMKQAVREVLQEERELQGPTAPSQPTESEPAPRVRVDPLAGKSPEELRALALAAKGSWKESEGTGTAVEIVRRLRDEWK